MIATLYPGGAKTDAKDAAMIADATRTMPHTLHSLELTHEITAELTDSSKPSAPRPHARLPG